MVERVLDLDFICELAKVFLSVGSGDGLLRVQTFGLLLLSQVNKWMRSYSNRLDSEEEELILRLSHKHVLLIDYGHDLLCLMFILNLVLFFRLQFFLVALKFT